MISSRKSPFYVTDKTNRIKIIESHLLGMRKKTVCYREKERVRERGRERQGERESNIDKDIDRVAETETWGEIGKKRD